MAEGGPIGSYPTPMQCEFNIKVEDAKLNRSGI